MMNRFECYGCHTVKDISAFTRDKTRKRGHRTRCKICEDEARFAAVVVGVVEKKCSVCGKTKPAEAFNKSIRAKSGLRSSCKQCDKASRPTRTPQIIRIEKDRTLRKQFGITLDQYDVLKSKQNSVCFVCQRENPHGWSLAVDHCHQTGIIRSLLCHGCNTSLGHLSENLDHLERLIEYAKLCIETKTTGKTGLFYRDSGGDLDPELNFIDTTRVQTVRSTDS